MSAPPQTPSDYTSLARRGMELYAKTSDPLTKSAVELVFSISALPLTEPQTTAVKLLETQLAAYNSVFPEPL